MNRNPGPGPAIWLAGDPADLKHRLHYGAAGIVTGGLGARRGLRRMGARSANLRAALNTTARFLSGDGP